MKQIIMWAADFKCKQMPGQLKQTKRSDKLNIVHR